MFDEEFNTGSKRLAMNPALCEIYDTTSRADKLLSIFLEKYFDATSADVAADELRHDYEKAQLIYYTVLHLLSDVRQSLNIIGRFDDADMSQQTENCVASAQAIEADRIADEITRISGAGHIPPRPVIARLTQISNLPDAEALPLLREYLENIKADSEKRIGA
ncbi:hypothetical protein SDC9_49402 [bioreactor metagenome]|uniref:Uncharacterized protein n=1 Tax=bioreactor metagenome TaxID=1076179 RepID=A0A644WH99_9ZZZZ